MSIVLALVFSFFGLQKTAAQGIDRESLAGEAAAQALHGADTPEDYNLRLGPVTLRASASLGTSFNDNINVARHGREADVIVVPYVGVNVLWQATELNALTFDLGIGYDYYAAHSRDSSLIISPNELSKLQLNVFVGDFKINFHDSFTFQNDPIQAGQVSNTAQFSRFLNDAGIQVDWDLNDIILTMAYDHTNLWVFGSSFDYLNYAQDSLSPKITFKVSKTVDAGFEAVFSTLQYDEHFQNDDTSVTAGPFVTAQLTPFLSANAQAGGIYTNYEKGGSNGDNEDIHSFYASGGLNHRINDVLTEGVTAGQEYIPGITSNFTQRIFANYTLNWQATNYISLGGNLWWENLDDSNAAFREDANRYGLGFTMAYALNEKASLSLGYQYVLKDADPSSLSYYQDVLTLGFSYQF